MLSADLRPDSIAQGYWISAYLPIILVEHWVFRKSRCSNYDVAIWNAPSKLPVGAAAVVAYAAAWGVGVTGMKKTWYVGPVGAHAGDIGIWMSLCMSALVYFILRSVELKVFKR